MFPGFAVYENCVMDRIASLVLCAGLRYFDNAIVQEFDELRGHQRTMDGGEALIVFRSIWIIQKRKVERCKRTLAILVLKGKFRR